MSSSIYEFIIDINSKIESVLARIGIFLGTELVCVFQFSEKKQSLRYSWPTDPESPNKPDRLKDFNIIQNLGDVFLKLKSLMLFFDSLDRLPQKQCDYLKQNNISSAIFIPIQNKGELWGCLCCMSENLKRTWKSEELSVLLKESIDLSSLVFLSETLSELKQADEQLSVMLNVVTDGIAISDENMVITSISGHIAELGGFAQEQLIGRAIWDFIDHDDHEKTRSNLQLAERGIRNVDLYRLLVRSGNSFLTRIGIRPLIKNGQRKGFIFLIVSLSTPTAPEIRLSEFQGYMNFVTDLVWTTDMDLLFTYVSPSAEHLLGYTSDEVMHLNAGLTLSKFTHKALAETFLEGLAAAKIKGRQFKTVIKVEQYRRDGRVMYGKALIALSRNPDGTPKGFIGVTHFRTEEPFAC